MSSEKRNTIIALFIVVAATLISFYPSLHGGFVNFDDDRYVYRNPMIRDLSWQGTATIFTSQPISKAICVGVGSYRC